MNECDISEFHLNDFYRNTGIKFCRIIGSALTNLKSRFILNIKDKYKIKKCNENGDTLWVTANWEEELIIMDVKKKEYELILFCMGSFGSISRIYSLQAGAPFAYVAIDAPTAPGQLSIEEFKKKLKL